MCRVTMDLNNKKNLDFAIYSLVLSKRVEFSARDLVQEVKQYQDIADDTLNSRISTLLDRWVESGLVQQHWDTFSVIM